MITTSQLRKIFNDKLAETDSMDAAFKKATWVAYNQGLKDGGCKNYKADVLPPDEETKGS